MKAKGRNVRITLAQLNPVIGDFEGNFSIIKAAVKKAISSGSDLIVFPEMIVSGYPPRDLLEREDFIQAFTKSEERLVNLSRETKDLAILAGTVCSSPGNGEKGLVNSAVLFHNGKRLFRQDKTLLPTYDVFEEARYFDPATIHRICPFGAEKLGITICEDAWNDPELFPRQKYSINPVDRMSKLGATIFINLSASPFGLGKDAIRYRLFGKQALKYRKPFIFVNQAGANDDLICDGRSMVFDETGQLLWIGPAFEEAVHTIDLRSKTVPVAFTPMDPLADAHDGLITGIRDYMRKCGFGKAVLGLSGGIDSAVTACLAVQAAGSDRIIGLSMPSAYTSESSITDARELALNLGISLHVVPIDSAYQTLCESLKPFFPSGPMDETKENIQARIRGIIIMAFSNKFGYLVLTSGNKSELSVGYCTLYGDMSGGLSVLSDVPKTMVYELARHINSRHAWIPESILTKAPSAELRPDQKDQDTLPPYDKLDAILSEYLNGMTRDDLIEKGFDGKTVDWVIDAMMKSEFKRRQAAPGLKITSKAFGTGRRMPIAQKWTG